MSQKERVLVTGASGYIAGHICRELLKRGYRVRGSVRDRESAKAAHLRGEQPLGIEGAALELVELDLRSDEGWAEAAEGCALVIHAASPLPLDVGYFTDPTIIEEAREGTLRCLRAAAGHARRVVLTSSLAALLYPSGDPRDPLKVDAPPIDESGWTPTDQWETLGSYHCSKAAAERAAWDFQESLAAEERFELVAINPSVVIGPLLSPSVRASVALFYRLAAGKLPGLPSGKILSPYVDVRDVAEAHVEALERSDVDGRRYILHHAHCELRALLEKIEPDYRARGLPWPRWNIPRWLIRLLALFSDDAKLLKLMLENSADEVRAIDGSRATRELGVRYRDLERAVRETLDSLIELGVARGVDK